MNHLQAAELERIFDISTRRQMSHEASTVLDSDELYNHILETDVDVPSDFAEPMPDTSSEVTFDNIVLDDVHVETARFSSAAWFEKIADQTIIIGGQGGISSWLTMLVAKTFPKNIFTYDFDRVERVNLAGQMFCTNDIGEFKGNAVARTIVNYCNYRSVYAVTERFTEETSACKVMLCGFDNMEARRVFFYSWKSLVLCLPEEERKTCLYIDGRLGAESMQILCIVGDAIWDMDKYEKDFLFSDVDADETVCSFKQTAFMANMIAAMMTNMLVNFCANLCGGCRTIPFFTSYEADQVFLKVEGGV